jgi:hypothetical protein
MAAASVPEIPRDWRLVALIGCVCFPASFALFHFVVPLGAWVAAAPELLVSALCAGLTTVLAMLIAGHPHHPAHANRQHSHARRDQ